MSIKYTITERISVTPLNKLLRPCDYRFATWQLEEYKVAGTDKSIGAFNPIGTNYQYRVGDTVEIREKIVLTNTALLTNVVNNSELPNVVITFQELSR